MHALDLKPRGHRWRSLTYCIVEAVWSDGRSGDSAAAALVHTLAHQHGDRDPLVVAGAPLPPDPAPLPAFISRFGEHNPLVNHTGSERTSEPRGAVKADVARAYAEVFMSHGVRSLHDIDGLLRDQFRLEHVDETLRHLPGEDQDGVRRAYLWLIAGDDHRVRPSTLVRRWLARHGEETDGGEASLLLAVIARRLTDRGSPTTPWDIHHAIWQAERQG